MNRFTFAVAAVCFALIGLAPVTACANPSDTGALAVLNDAEGALARLIAPTDPRQRGALVALDEADGALARVLSADSTLRVRIVSAYHAEHAANPAVAAIDRASYSSASLYRVLQPQPSATVAAR